MFAMYLIWYGFGRMLIEGLRTDSLYLGPVRISQFVGFASCILGIVIFVVHHFRVKKAAAETVEYTSVYDELHPTASEPEKAKETETNEAEDTDEPDKEN